MYHVLVSRSVPVPSIAPDPIRPSLVKLSSNMIVDIKFFINKYFIIKNKPIVSEAGQHSSLNIKK